MAAMNAVLVHLQYGFAAKRIGDPCRLRPMENAVSFPVNDQRRARNFMDAVVERCVTHYGARLITRFRTGRKHKSVQDGLRHLVPVGQVVGAAEYRACGDSFFRRCGAQDVMSAQAAAEETDAQSPRHQEIENGDDAAFVALRKDCMLAYFA